MPLSLLSVQTLNGLQLGVLLFLIAAGLTLVFGVMDFINLAHGVQYMLGAYLAVMFYGLTGNFLFALILALAAALAFGLLLEFAVFRHLYDRNHLDQVIECERGGESEDRSEEHTSELQSPHHIVCRLLLQQKSNSVLHASPGWPRQAGDNVGS